MYDNVLSSELVIKNLGISCKIKLKIRSAEIVCSSFLKLLQTHFVFQQR
ncbi:MAG: hypothetical protein ACI94O_002027, partial [Octadecabacter sp.]